MNKAPKSEKRPPLDFLDAATQVTFSFHKDAAAWLPEVSKEDLRTRREKYAVLLGRIADGDGGGAHIVVEAVMQMTEEERGYYQEGVGSVENINLGALRNAVAEVQAKHPEYAGMQIVGDVHTHPVTQEEVRVSPTTPSDADIQSIAEWYKGGELNLHYPFIFGIGCLGEDGEPEYSFYRLVRIDSGFGYKHLD